MSHRMSSQDDDHIYRKSHTYCQSIEETYAGQMMHVGTYLLVRELTAKAADCEVRPDQDGCLVLTQQGVSSMLVERTDESTWPCIGLEGESIAAPLPQGSSSTK